MSDLQFTLAELAQRLELTVEGDADTVIDGLATLSTAGSGKLSFLANPRYQIELATCTASAVIVSPAMLPHCPVAALVSDNPYLSYARASQLFDPMAAPAMAGIHPSASIDPSAKVADSAQIAAQVVVEAGTVIGEAAVIGAGCVIERGCKLGPRALLHANVTLCHGVTIGSDVILHSGVVLGSDGFGFAPSKDGWVKIAQLGGVTLGDRVEIGANTTVDRGALDDTRIGNGVIIDNQVQIAHNVQIGDGVAIAGQSGIAGSSTLGCGVTVAGGVGIAGHLEIADNVHITAMTLVSKSIKKPGSFSSGTVMQPTRDWHKSVVRFNQLESLNKRVKALEKQAVEQQPEEDSSL